MFFEFQLSSSTLCRIIRNRLHHIDFCVTDTFAFQGNSLMIDRILVPATSVLQRMPADFTIHVGDGTQTIQGSKAVIAQPVQINFVKIDDLVTNGPNSSSPAFSPVITVLIDIVAFVQNNGAQLKYTFNTIDWGIYGVLMDDKLKQKIIDMVSSRVQPITRMIDISSIQSLMPGVPLSATNAGVTTTSDGGIMILRVEVNGADDQVSSWTRFCNTYNVSLVGSGDWAMLMDKDMLISSVRNTLATQLEASRDSFSLNDGIDVSWNYAAGPVINVGFSGEVIDACTCFWGEIDLDVDVSTSITLLVPASDVLRTHIHTTYDADDLEVSCCALTAALFWPIVGSIYLSKDRISFGQYLLGMLIKPVGVFIAVCVAAGNQSVGSHAGAQGTCNEVDKETIECDRPISLNMGTFGGTYHLTTIGARPEGPMLGGTTTGIQDLFDPLISISSVSELNWGLGGNCSSGFGPKLSGEVTFKNTVWGSILTIGDVSVIEDPLKFFQKIYVTSSGITISPILTDDYLANPYPCKLRIVSNGGVRIITLAPPKEITTQESMALGQEAILAKAGCYKKFTPPWAIMKFKWLPDPPLDMGIAQLWQIVVSGMIDQESIDIIGQDDHVLITALPNSNGVGELSYWSEIGTPHNELAVRFNTTGGKRANSQRRNTVKRHVSVKQAQFVLRSQIGFMGNFERMSLNRLNNSTVLSIQTSTSEYSYDISLLQFPSLRSSSKAATEERLIFAKHNLRLLHRGDQIEVANNEGRILSRIECPLPANVAMGRDHLFVIKDGAIEAFKLGDSAALERISRSELPFEGGTRIERVRVAGVSCAFCITDRSGTRRIIDLSDSGNPKELGRYFHDPWFANACRNRRILAKLSPDHQHISIYELQQVIDI